MMSPGITTESGAKLSSAGSFPTRANQRLQGLLDRYRISLAALLLLLLLLGTDYVPYGHHDPRLALLITMAWLLFGAYRGLLHYELPFPAQLLVDITLVTLLIHASGGVSSGLGMLLVLPLALAGILLPPRIAALFAAIAALALLGEELHAHLNNRFAPNYFQAGLSGAIYFATVLLAALLAQRLRESERHIEQQSSELADLTQLNTHIIEQMQTGIVVADGDGRLHRMNRAAARALQAPAEPMPDTLTELSPELAQTVKRWQEHGQSTEPVAIDNGRLTLRLIPLYSSQRSGCIILHLEESAALAQQAQQMKLAALGRLTASIAHEIRNPVGAISHAAQLLAESPRLNGVDRRLTEIVHKQTERVNTIIENVMQLGRGQPADMHRIPLKPWLDSLAQELRETEQENGVSIQVEVTPPHLEILFDPEHLHQVVENLYRNARNAAGGDLTLRLRAATTESHTPFLLVCDNGPGIEPELEGRIFEPFFTTGTKHTGLGLYIVRELCSANQAAIRLIPRHGSGACFRIDFATPHTEFPR